MFLPDAASFVSSLFFAVHPIHTEAVRNNGYRLFKLFICICNQHANIASTGM